MSDSINNILNINFLTYAHSLGYTQFVKGKESARWVSLKNPTSGDTIRVRTKPLPMVYNNNSPSLNQDRGNIINFQINRLEGLIAPIVKPSKKDFSQAFTILKKYMGDYDYSKDYKPSFTKADKNDDYMRNEAVKSYIKQLVPINNYVVNYLTKYRSLKKDTFLNPLFLNTIMASPVAMANGKIIFNTAFLKKDLSGKIQGFISYFYKAQTKTHAKKILTLINIPYISNVKPDSKNLFLAESAIDCLSHYQIFLPPKAAYIGFGGALSAEKKDLIFNAFSNLKDPSKNLISITDNDTTGFYYDLELAVHFNNKLFPNQFIDVQQHEKTTKYVFHNNNDNLDISLLKNKITDILENEANTKSYNGYVSVFKTKDLLFVEIPRFSKMNYFKFIEPLTNFIFKACDINYKSQKSPLKDWNDVVKKYENENNIDKKIPQKKNKRMKLN